MQDRTILRRAAAVALPVFALTLTACAPDPEEMPEIGEIEVDSAEMEREYDPELVLTSEDLGETWFVNGWVAADPAGDGFLVRTDGNQMILVQSAEEVTLGGPVRVTGVLRALDVARLEQLEAEAFEPGVEVEWEMDRTYYLDAITVEMGQVDPEDVRERAPDYPAAAEEALEPRP